jgi:hypothetical protein
MAIVTLAEARAQLQIRDSDTSQDTVLQAYCDAITPTIEKKTGEVVDQRTITEERDLSWPSGSSTFVAGFQWTWTLHLHNRPTISLTSVTNLNTGFVWPLTGLHLSPEGRLRVMSGTPLSGFISVVYVAGYATVPADYKQAALLILQHNWQPRRGVGNVQAGLVGGGPPTNTLPALLIPDEALGWLDSPIPGGP